MKTLPQQPESELVKAAITAIKAYGGHAWRNNSGFLLLPSRNPNGRSRAITMGEKGLPDVVGVLPGGRMVVIECKRRGNTLSDDQREQLDKLRDRNALVVVAYDILDVQKALASSQEGFECPESARSNPRR